MGTIDPAEAGAADEGGRRHGRAAAALPSPAVPGAAAGVEAAGAAAGGGRSILSGICDGVLTERGSGVSVRGASAIFALSSAMSLSRSASW